MNSISIINQYAVLNNISVSYIENLKQQICILNVGHNITTICSIAELNDMICSKNPMFSTYPITYIQRKTKIYDITLQNYP